MEESHKVEGEEEDLPPEGGSAARQVSPIPSSCG